MGTARDNRRPAMRASYDSSAAAMDCDPSATMHRDRSAAVRATHGNGSATMNSTSPSMKAADQHSVGRRNDGASGIRLDVDAICEIAAGDHEHDGGGERN